MMKIANQKPPKSTLKHKIKRRLQKQAVNTQQNLSLILIGFACSLLGIGLVMGGEFLVQDLWHRELVALLGIIIIAIGCLLAISGYLSMSILKIFYVITRDDPDSND
jgi:predicted acyltransferase